MILKLSILQSEDTCNHFEIGVSGNHGEILMIISEMLIKHKEIKDLFLDALEAVDKVEAQTKKSKFN
jgi:hypothetical protein